MDYNGKIHFFRFSQAHFANFKEATKAILRKDIIESKTRVWIPGISDLITDDTEIIAFARGFFYLLNNIGEKF